MKAIILAAGMGTRLGKYTESLPKGMLNFNGKTLIERQIEVLNSCGVSDISIVTGYNKEKINYSNVKYFHNPDFFSTNMVASLMKAKEELNDDVLILYSDIIYQPSLIKNMINSTCEVGVMADVDYMDYWKARLDDWELDMESFIYDLEDNVLDMGDTDCSLEDAKVRYVGMIKLSKSGAEKFKSIYEKNYSMYWELDKPWKKSKSFKQAYMTCMIKELIDSNLEVKLVKTNRGWLEFDTTEDYEKAVDWVKSDEIKKYIEL